MANNHKYTRKKESNLSKPPTVGGDTVREDPSSLDATRQNSPITPNLPGSPTAPTLRSDHAPNVPLTRPAQIGNDARYDEIREFARGGMGRIMLVFDSNTGRKIALKETLQSKAKRTSRRQVTPGKRTREEVNNERFLREAKVTARLEHPNIVPVYEIGEKANGELYYTMRFVAGEDIGVKLKAIRVNNQLSPDERFTERMKLLDPFVDMCNALAYAHNRGVIHRDLKPANVMIGEFGETVLIDWGLAKTSDADDANDEKLMSTIKMLTDGEEEQSSDKSNLTLDGSVLGTPAYMPPEQAMGHINLIDARADIYALGAILYEILTGEVPYKGRSAMAIVQAVIAGPPESVHSHYDKIPPELAHLVERSMERDIDKRMSAAKELADEISAFRAGKALESYSYSRGETFKRFIRKNKAVVMTTMLALTVILVGGTMALIQMKEDRDAAVTAKEDAEAAERVALDEQIRADKNAEEERAAKEEAVQAKADLQESQAGLVSAKKDAESQRDAATKALDATQRERAFSHLRAAKEARAEGASIRALLHEAKAIETTPEKWARDHLVAAAMTTPAILWEHAQIAPPLGSRYALSPDGRFVASIKENIARVYDGLSNRLIGETALLRNSARAMSWAPDGESLLVFYWDGALTRLEINPMGFSESLLGEIKDLNSPVLSQDGSMITGQLAGATLIYAILQNDVKLVGTSDGPLGDKLTGRYPTPVAGGRFFFVSADGIKSVNASTLKDPKTHLATANPEWLQGLSFALSPKGQSLLAWNEKASLLRVVNLQSGALIDADGSRVRRASWIGEDRFALEVADEISIHQVRGSTLSALSKVQNSKLNLIATQAMANGEYYSLLATDNSGLPHLLFPSIKEGKDFRSLSRGSTYFGELLASSQGGRWLALQSGNTIKVLHASKGELFQNFSLPGQATRAIFSADGEQLWVRSTNYAEGRETLTRFDLASGDSRAFDLSAFASTSFALSGNGKLVAYFEHNSAQATRVRLVLIDSKSGMTRHSTHDLASGPIVEVKFDLDGLGLKSRAQFGEVRWWSLKTMKSLPPIGMIESDLENAGIEKDWRNDLVAFGTHNGVYAKVNTQGVFELLPTAKQASLGAASIRVVSNVREPAGVSLTRDGRLALVWNREGEWAIIDVIAESVALRDASLAGLRSALIADNGQSLFLEPEDGSIRGLDLSGLASALPYASSLSLGGFADFIATKLSADPLGFLNMEVSTFEARLGPRTGELIVPAKDDTSERRSFLRLSPYDDATTQLLSHDGAASNLTHSANRKHYAFPLLNAGKPSLVVVGFGDSPSAAPRVDTYDGAFQKLVIHNDGSGHALQNGALVQLSGGSVLKTFSFQPQQWDYRPFQATSDGKTGMGVANQKAITFNLSTGAELGRCHISQGSSDPILSADGRVIYITKEGLVVAYDSKTGAKQWESPQDIVTWEALIRFGDDHLVAYEIGGYAALIDAKDGKILQRIHLRHLEKGTITDADATEGVVLIAAESTQLYRINIAAHFAMAAQVAPMGQEALIDWASARSASQLKGFSIESQASNGSQTWPKGEQERYFGAIPSWYQEALQLAPKAAFKAQRLARITHQDTRAQARRKAFERFNDLATWWQRTQAKRWNPASLTTLELFSDAPAFSSAETRLAMARWKKELGASSAASSLDLAEALLTGLSNARNDAERKKLRQELLSHARASNFQGQEDMIRAAVVRARSSMILDDLPSAQREYRAAFDMLGNKGQRFESLVRELILAYAAKNDFEAAVSELKLRPSGSIGGEFYQSLITTLRVLGITKGFLHKRELSLPRMMVFSTVNGSYAKLAGLMSGDILVEIDNTQIQHPADLPSYMRRLPDGMKVGSRRHETLTIIRDGKFHNLVLSFDAGDASHGMLLRQYIGDEDDSTQEEATTLYESADEEWQKIQSLDHKSQAFIQGARKVEAFARKSLAKDKTSRANYLLGRALFFLKDYDAATTALHEALTLSKTQGGVDAPTIHLLLGSVAEGKKDWRETITHYELATTSANFTTGEYGALLSACLNGGFYDKGLDLAAKHRDDIGETFSVTLAGIKACKGIQRHVTKFPVVVLYGIAKGYPAEAAGVQDGDILTAIGGVKIASNAAFDAELKRLQNAGTKEATYTLQRGAKTIQVTLPTRGIGLYNHEAQKALAFTPAD